MGSGIHGVNIDADFPGGNIIVDSIQGDTIWLHQDFRDTVGYWFYWYFRVCGAAGRTLDFHFTRLNGNHICKGPQPKGSAMLDWADPIGVRGPAVSLDGGRTWRWLGTRSVREASFSFTFPKNAQDVRFSVGIPYVKSNLDAFLRRHLGDPSLKTGVLCHTNQKRPVEILRLGKVDGEPDYRVLLTARNHACEAMSNYVLEGIMAAVLADTPEGAWLRNHIEFLVVPFMDTDGVQDGNQGKNQYPRDHNRDYGSGSIYPSVRAIKELVPRWSGGRLRIVLDIHCPGLRGTDAQEISFVGGPNAKQWKQVERLSQTLESVQTGPLKFSSKNNMPFGESWNTLANVKPGEETCDGWGSHLDGIWFATTIEVPYASSAGMPMMPDSARSFGRDLARALGTYLTSHTDAT